MPEFLTSGTKSARVLLNKKKKNPLSEKLHMHEHIFCTIKSFSSKGNF